MKQIAFMLGKPVRPGTIFPEVFQRLEAGGASVSTHVPNSRSDVMNHSGGADLIVQRGLSSGLLESVQTLEDDGVRFCNRILSSIDVRNRMLTYQRLKDDGLPCPPSFLFRSWNEVLKHVMGTPSVVKAVDGATGRGWGVFVAERGELPPTAPFSGPYLVQEYISNDGWIYKAYVAGKILRGLIKRPDACPGQRSVAETFIPHREFADSAIRAGTVLGLEIYGVDFLRRRSEPIIVDVNAFPGFRRVPEAAQLVATCLRDIAWSQAELQQVGE